MAIFEGTLEEFERLLGPRVRNRLQSKTKPFKKMQKHLCGRCGQKRELEAVHSLGSKRIEIASRMLRHRADHRGIVRIDDIKATIEEMVAENMKCIIGYWCHSCHASQDPQVGRYGIHLPPSHVEVEA